MTQDIPTVVINIVAEVTKRKPLTIFEDNRFIADLDIDSLDAIIILHKVEKAFNIKISLREANTCETVGELIRLVKIKVK